MWELLQVPIQQVSLLQQHLQLIRVDLIQLLCTEGQVLQLFLNLSLEQQPQTHL